MSKTALEERVQGLVAAGPRVPGGPWFVDLRQPGAAPFSLGPYANPAHAQEQAEKLRQFVVGLLREAGASG